VTDIEQRYGDAHLLEIESLSRFRIQCRERDIVLRAPEHNGLAIDQYTGKYGLQLKYSGCHSKSTGYCQASLKHKVNGVKGTPYSLSASLGHFLIIPLAELVNSGHINTADQTGKTYINLYAHGAASTNEWSKYWDRYDLLQQ
jgi:hypothetical protein